jgi:hypothetical protein
MYLFNETEPLKVVNKLPYNPLKDSELYARCVAESEGSVQFSHTAEEQIGGQLKAGLVLTDLFEDRGTGVLDEYVPLFLMTRAEKL